MVQFGNGESIVAVALAIPLTSTFLSEKVAAVQLLLTPFKSSTQRWSPARAPHLRCGKPNKYKRSELVSQQSRRRVATRVTRFLEVFRRSKIDT